MDAYSRANTQCLAVALFLSILCGCRVTDWRLWRPSEPPADSFAVETLRDIAYTDGPQAHGRRHRLDVYLPKGQKDFPVVILVHGGAWLLGDNRCCGLYSSVGEFLASQGIGVVMPNYRLSPGAKHPDHIKDVACAFAWTKENIGKHGGRADKIYLAGHSAGGHLVALLATDERYLHAHGCQIADIRGVICVSGIYHIPDAPVDVLIGGSSPLSMRLDEMFPLRGDAGTPDKWGARGLPFTIKLASIVFGDDPTMRLEASPLHHVRPGLPPFLLLNAQKDLPILPDMAAEMHRKLRLHGCESSIAVVENCNHNSVMFNAIEPRHPTARAIVEFVRAH